MDIDSSNANNGTSSPLNENCLVAVPVVAGASGDGLPYAPEDWPCPGDKWRWKVGHRKSVTGYWLDKTLFAPPSCPKYDGKKPVFFSKASLVDYLHKEFPQTDTDDFFSRFIWKVPSANNKTKAGTEYTPVHEPSRRLTAWEHCRSELSIRYGYCKAGNKLCSSNDVVKSYALLAKDCNICCSETGFCCSCCCILCCKIVDQVYGGYSYIRCEAILDDDYVCGHVAHIKCALRSYLAGTVGGTINLDVEYYCRRCDNRTDLMSHVSKLLKFCETLNSSDGIEKILNIGFSILSGSEQKKAKILCSNIGQVIAKLKCGMSLEEIWKMDDNKGDTTSEGMSLVGNDVTILGTTEKTRNESKINCINNIDPPQKMEETNGHARSPVYITSDCNSLSVKLEDEVDQALEELIKSQQLEHDIAEEKLYHQKDFLLSLYRQLEYDRSELAKTSTSPKGGGSDDLLSNVLERVEQIKVEQKRLKEMLKVAHGFGRASRKNLAENFGIAVDD